MGILKKNLITPILLSVLVMLLFINTIINILFPKPKKETPKVVIPTIAPQGSPETSKIAEETTKNFYPLAPYSPPEEANFYFLYTGRLQMKVFLIGNREAAKKEFEEWAKLKGVDLGSHQITYVSPP